MKTDRESFMYGNLRHRSSDVDVALADIYNKLDELTTLLKLSLDKSSNKV